jgi:hypothetical protein
MMQIVGEAATEGARVNDMARNKAIDLLAGAMKHAKGI